MIDEFEQYLQKVDSGVDYLSTKLPSVPEVAVVLGTGLGSVIDCIEATVTIPYSDIPGFPATTVISHAGKLIYGKLADTNIIVLQGRFHYYEGYSTRELTIPIRVLGLLGVKKLVLTNAAGGLNLEFLPGSIMMISDHINLISDNPLRGPNLEEWGPRFPDLSQVYDADLAAICRGAAADIGLDNFCSGIYCAIPGPNLETPAETRYLRQCGADAVGMSTIPEVIVACHCGMHVLGLSVIANVNDPDDFHPIAVNDILSKMAEASIDLTRLLEKILPGF